MTPPAVVWHILWREHRPSGERDEQRRYRSATRCARQVLAVLSAPDDVAELRELYETEGWERDGLAWKRLDPRGFVVAALSDETADEDDDEGLLARYAKIEQAWREHQERVAGRPGSLPAPPGTGGANGPPLQPPPAARPATASPATKGT